MSSMPPESRAGAGGGPTAEAPPVRPAIPVPTALTARRRPLSVEETSAGGVVVDDSTGTLRAALIGKLDRRGRLTWSLPKGHIEPGESAEEAAVREVEEETGIKGVITDRLGDIDYWFVAENRRIHKTVHHFLMRSVGGALSAEDPEVVAVEWVEIERVGSRLAYADERRLLEDVPRLLAKRE